MNFMEIAINNHCDSRWSFYFNYVDQQWNNASKISLFAMFTYSMANNGN